MGVILYEMLTGELPFVADSALALMMKHVQEEPQPPRQRRPDLDIPPDLEALVLKALSKDREDRPASAEAMLAALPGEAASGGYPSVTTGVAARPAARWALPAVGGVLLLVAVGASLWAVFDSEPRQGGGEPIATADQGAAPAATSGRAAGATEARAGAPRDGGRRADAASGPRLTRLTLKVSPARATVFVDGKRLEGRTVSRAPGTVIAVRATARRCGALRREITFKRRDFQETIVIRCRRHGAGSGSRHKDKIGDTAPNPFAR